MADSDFDRPLGLGRVRLSARRGMPYRLIAFSGLGLIAAGLFVFISSTGDPMGGEPYAIAAIHEEMPKPPQADGQAASKTPDPQATGTTLKRVTSAEDFEQQSGVKVMRAGASVPGALIITVPQDLGIHLPPAPDPRLVEKTRFGAIPRIGSDGSRPAEVYARPSVSAANLKTGAPRIALLIGGMGLDALATGNAIESLPGAVTLGFAPYGHDLERETARAREHGHETVLQLPMEPFDFPRINPGPHTLLTSANAAENTDHLHWLLSRFTGYAGVANFLGAKFTSDEQALLPVLREIAGRGLFYVDDGTSAQSLVTALAPELNLATGKTDVAFDGAEKQGTLETALLKLEARARDKGIAVGVASGLPLSDIDRIARFAQSLEAKGINLVPLSAALSKDALGGRDGTRPVVTREP
jgi:polysaccharide deacetylase 2 family uncharacterized protein YibQ